MAENPSLPAKPRRIWKIVLVLSLALNLAVAGIVVGSVASGRAGPDGPRNFDLGVGPMTRALNREERRTLSRNLRESRALRDLNPRERIGGLVAALQAEPFDPAALQTQLEEQSQKMDGVQMQAQAAFLALVSDMTPERRQAFAAQLSEELSRPRPFRERRSGG
ncbi:periplasmic heavy metal sensor [Loktanella sp. Alg231-35]|uniref:periplasmic heavy metal sensor n=1 Tax=Loktanella sp. Alg231-35 TaxID=1922220 RepID=UPI000D54BC76|nr:periplasmic heavy metal sensor [Loktanella sp. Alg231-35]